MNIADLGTILTVWAHPDDEVFTMGGILAQASKNGQEIYCVTATKGELGIQDEARWPAAQLAEIRTKEMADCLHILGIKNHHWLTYHDGSMMDEDGETAVSEIVEQIQMVQPDSVFTFAPDGLTGHPDHQTICKWTTDAFKRAAKPSAKLYYVALSQESFANMSNSSAKKDIFFATDQPIVTPDDQLAIKFDLPENILDAKIKALRAHESQMTGMYEKLGEAGFRNMASQECFKLSG